MHDIDYFIKIKDEINEYIKKNTIVKLNELFFKLDKNLDIMNIIVTCFTDNAYEDLTNNDINNIKANLDIEKYLTTNVSYNNIVLNLLTKSDKSQFYYNNLFTKINKDVDNDDINKNYYKFSYYLHFNLNENDDFDLEIKDSEGRILSKENLQTIINSLMEGEHYD